MQRPDRRVTCQAKSQEALARQAQNTRLVDATGLPLGSEVSFNTPSAIAGGKAAETKYPWPPLPRPISFAWVLCQEDGDNVNYIRLRIAVPEYTRDSDQTRDRACSEVAPTTHAHLKCGFELGLVRQRKPGEFA